MTEDRKDILAGQVELDLRGFQRRVPRRAIATLLGSAEMGASLSLTFNAVMDSESVTEAIRCSGAEVVFDEITEHGRRVVVRPGRSAAQSLELDMRGRRCPAPVIEARRQLRKMSPGERLRMVTDCTGAPTEVDSWAANSTGITLLGKWPHGRDHVFLLARV